MIPGFRKLPQEDQIALLKAGSSLFPLILIFFLFNNKKENLSRNKEILLGRLKSLMKLCSYIAVKFIKSGNYSFNYI